MILGDSVHLAPWGGFGRSMGHSILLFYQHGESYLGAVRRPCDFGRGLVDAGDLSDGPFCIHPAYEYLWPLGLARRDECQPVARGRPTSIRAIDQKAIAGAVGVHDPERTIAADRPACRTTGACRRRGFRRETVWGRRRSRNRGTLQASTGCRSFGRQLGSRGRGRESLQSANASTWRSSLRASCGCSSRVGG